jgi:hypothetical protein
MPLMMYRIEANKRPTPDARVLDIVREMFRLGKGFARNNFAGTPTTRIAQILNLVQQTISCGQLWSAEMIPRAMQS